MNVKIAQVMNPHPVCIEKKATLKQITDIIKSEGYSHVPVVEDGKLVGVVSKTDLVVKFTDILEHSSGQYYSSMIMNHKEVSLIMHSDPVVLRETDDIKYATELLLQGEFHGVPVVDDENRVVGIVTAYDILKAMSDRD
jgi:CBS domain-containing protein